MSESGIYFQSGILGLVIALSFISSGNAEPLDTFRDCDVCPEMIELPMGSFTMGAPEDEFRRNLVWRDGAFHRATPEHPHVKEDEGPQHVVIVDIPIAMGRNEVTYDEWMACVADGGCGGYVPPDTYLRHGPLAKDDHALLWVGGRYPVLGISYQDAVAYTDWLNAKLGTNAYRLPTEAEWEYAARAGTTTRFAQGDTLTSDQANFSGTMTAKVLLEEWPDLLSRGAPVPVDDLDSANGWGLRHMSGNVEELTSSCYLGPEVLYAGWPTTSRYLRESADECPKRVARGGGMASPMDLLRSAWRAPQDPTLRRTSGGFRVVKELD